MITIRKHASSGISVHVGTRPENPSLPPALSKLMRESVPMLMPKKKLKQIVAYDKMLSAGMRRILEQHKSGTYDADDYSTRTCQRHRKFFLEMGIDLRKPYSTSSIGLPLSESRQKSAPKKKLKSNLLPVTVPSDAYRKAEQTDVTLAARIKRMPEQTPIAPVRQETVGGTVIAKMHGLRVKRHKAVVRTTGLAAIARFR